MKRIGIRALLFAAAIAFSAPSQSALLFSDNFDADSATTVLDFDGLIHWNVVDGTVDYIRSGSFGIQCVGGTGGCIDLLGSEGTAGRLVSRQTFLLSADVAYFLSAQVSGNQRNVGSNEFTLGFVDADTGSLVASATSFAILATRPFEAQGLGFITGNPIEVRLFFESAGTSNVGPILDSVTFADLTAVPEPGALALLALGLAGMAASKRSAGSGRPRVG